MVPGNGSTLTSMFHFYIQPSISPACAVGLFASHAGGDALFSMAARTIDAASAGTLPINRSMKSPYLRALSQAQKFRQRLGGSPCTDDPFPQKPKGMHWRTYDRLVKRGEALDEQAERAGMAIFGRLLQMVS
jgi:hypothetical protein